MDPGLPETAASDTQSPRGVFVGLFAPSVRDAICGEGLSVVRLVIPASERLLDLQLFCADGLEAEVELTLAIRDVETGLVLAGLNFCLVQNEGERVAIIGSVHAAVDPRMRSLIRDVTKDLFGFRPKALALWCLQQLTSLWGVSQIQAVGDVQQVRCRWRKQVEITARYDEFWRESDGRELSGGGGWRLPLRPHYRTRDELKPSRRRAHERRYSMLAGLQPTLIAAFAALVPGPEGSFRAMARPMEHICSSGGTGFCESRAMRTSDLLATNHSF
jgi:hypothetical protein